MRGSSLLLLSCLASAPAAAVDVSAEAVHWVYVCDEKGAVVGDSCANFLKGVDAPRCVDVSQVESKEQGVVCASGVAFVAFDLPGGCAIAVCAPEGTVR